jgi:hypothetical protein
LFLGINQFTSTEVRLKLCLPLIGDNCSGAFIIIIISADWSIGALRSIMASDRIVQGIRNGRTSRFAKAIIKDDRIDSIQARLDVGGMLMSGHKL